MGTELTPEQQKRAKEIFAIERGLDAETVKELCRNNRRFAWIKKRIKSIKETTDDEWAANKLDEVYQKADDSGLNSTTEGDTAD